MPRTRPNVSHSQEQPWSNSPNAPKIPYYIYRSEKTWFAGAFIGSILYGILVVLFFNCISTLFNPVHRRAGSIKWGLASYAAIMFSVVTLYTATSAHILSTSYVDNRDFPGGPYLYRGTTVFEGIGFIPRTAFRLNNWLADGLLLYRCYMFYSRNLWVIAFPFLIYLTSVAMGILTLLAVASRSSLPYISISLSLNILLTLMIVVRLILYGRNVRAATGSPVGISGLYKTIATMLIESSALFAVSSLLVIGATAVYSPITNTFSPILAVTQVIASLFIIQRVASKSALTRDAVVSGSIGSFKARTRGEFTDCSDDLPGGSSVSSVDKRGINTSGELEVGIETTIDIRRGSF